MLRVDPPPDRAVVHPAANRFRLCGCDLKTALHRRCLQNRKDFAGGETSRQNFKDPKIGIDDSATGARFAIGNRVRNFVLRIFRHAKYRIDKGRINGNVRRHHDDVFRLQCRIALKQIEQVIVQNLQLPYHAVTGMNLQGPIGRRDGSLHFGWARFQFENVALNFQQQCRGSEFLLRW